MLRFLLGSRVKVGSGRGLHTQCFKPRNTKTIVAKQLPQTFTGWLNVVYVYLTSVVCAASLYGTFIIGFSFEIGGTGLPNIYLILFFSLHARLFLTGASPDY